jgi:hypothetical protein
MTLAFASPWSMTSTCRLHECPSNHPHVLDLRKGDPPTKNAPADVAACTLAIVLTKGPTFDMAAKRPGIPNLLEFNTMAGVPIDMTGTKSPIRGVNGGGFTGAGREHRHRLQKAQHDRHRCGGRQPHRRGAQERGRRRGRGGGIRRRRIKGTKQPADSRLNRGGGGKADRVPLKHRAPVRLPEGRVGSPLCAQTHVAEAEPR